jgi:hypothetical protein
MRKDELRPIEYNLTALPQKGYFHQWLIFKDEEGNEYAKALIETEKGTMEEIRSTSFRFID